METPELRLSSQGTNMLNKMYRSVRNLENISREQDRKLNILLVLSCGNLVLTVLVLIALFIMR